MKTRIEASVNYLKERGLKDPEVGVILGTGLSKLLDEVEILVEIPYHEIPHFSTTTVEYHEGKLLYGKLSGKRVLLMHGRFHLYEGYTLQEVTYPVRVMQALGIKTLLVSNAAGAINLSYKKGDIMLINDHINLQGGSPLAFKGAAEHGNVFVDMREPYDSDLIEDLLVIAERFKIKLHQGVYASVVGPQLETKAEYRMLKILGADAVGMSTVPEIIVARQLGLRTAALSVLTDECDPDDLKPIDIPEILKIIQNSEPQMVNLLKELIERL